MVSSVANSIAVPRSSSKLTDKDISLKASSLIMSSSIPLDTLMHLSQDFPKYTAALARKVDVSPNIQDRLLRILARGRSMPALFINGRGYIGNEINAFSYVQPPAYSDIMSSP